MTKDSFKYAEMIKMILFSIFWFFSDSYQL